MTKIELLNEIKTRNLQIAEVMDKIKEEKRELTNVEKINVESWKQEAREFELKMKDVEKQEILDAVKPAVTTKNFSLIRSIRDIAEGRQIEDNEVTRTGAEIFKRAGLGYNGQIAIPVNYEKRADILANTANLGQEAIAENKLNLVGALYANSVIFKAGAQLLSNLTGTVSVPVYAGTSSAWATETGATSNGGGAFSEITLEARRLTTYVDVSKLFLLQDSTSAEQLLMNDIQNSIIAKLENTILDASAASTSRPAGLFNGVTYTSSLTGSTTWAKVVGMEGAVDTNNALMGNLAYLVHPSINTVFKTTAKASNQAIFIKEGNTVNGYNAYVTSNMPTILSSYKGTIFGNFSDLIVGQWGGMDITVDPYTQAGNGKVRLVINTYWSWAKRRTASFSFNYLS